MTKEQVGFCLVTAAIALQPGDHIIVEPHRNRAFGWPVEAADFRAAPVGDLGHVGEINRSVCLGGDAGDVPLARGCELPHKTSFPERTRLVPRSGER